ncbi:MAG: flippase-like domain-containing protein, partial [Thermomicrobiales bacterium]|nr:flippase-like domain-containing protein [Thermomicrobiales bacterium]
MSEDAVRRERGGAGAAPAAVAADEPGPGPQSLGKRVLRPETIGSFVVAAVILVFFMRRLQIDPQAVWDNVQRANPWWLLAAVAIWYSGFILRAVRWRRMLALADIDAAHGYAIPTTPGLIEILLLSWFANCVAPAKLGDAYRCYLLKQESRAPFSSGLGTLIAERLTDLVVLCFGMLAVGLAIFRGRLPSAAFHTFELGGALLAIAAVGLGAMWFFRHALERRVPARFQQQFGRLHDAIFSSMREPWLMIGVSVAIWLTEGFRFWFVAISLDAGIPFAAAMFIAMMGSLLTA